MTHEPNALAIPVPQARPARARRSRALADSLWGPALLVFAVFLPPSVYTIANTSSNSAGCALACLAAVLAWPRFLWRDQRSSRLATLSVVAIVMAILVHSAVANVFQPFSWIRATSSSILLALLIMTGVVIAKTFYVAREATVDATCRRMFWTMAALLAVGVLGIVPSEVFGRTKVVFPFSEPSVFALAFEPFLIYAVACRRGWQRIAILLATLVLAYLIQNLTLVVGTLLAGLLCLRARSMAMLMIVALAGFTLLDTEYFTSRLTVDETENLSTLVYVQGWQLVQESWEASRGWGLGFQQMGEQPTSAPASEVIYTLTGSDLNLADGGFLLAKLTSEFGAWGAAGTLVLVLFMVRIAWRLRRSLAGNECLSAADLLSSAVIVSFSIDLLIRGTGYFSGSTMMLAAAVAHRALVTAARPRLRLARSNIDRRLAPSSPLRTGSLPS